MKRPELIMKSWPVARVLLMTTIADWLKCIQSRDFTLKDIVRLHPSTTPHPGGFKCFTCQDAADNYECNRWAPDEFCPKGTRFCSMLHMMDDRGQSVSVTKRCATLQDCLFTGCAQVTDSGYQMCASCCEGNICNLLVPKNESSAVFSATSPLFSSSRSLHPTLRSDATVIFIIIIIIIITAGRV